MNILYLAHRIPFPPNKGDKLRSFHQIEHLSRNHSVWCACFVDRPEDWRHVPSLRRYCRDVAAFELRPVTASLNAIRGLAAGGVGTCRYFSHLEMQPRLRRWAREIGFDVVVAFSSSMAPYALAVPANRRVIDLCDCDSQKWLEYGRRSWPPRRWLYRTEGRRLARFERECVARFDETTVISETEAATLLPSSSGRVHIVANGVMVPSREPARTVTLHHEPGPIVGFVGALDYRPNVDGLCWFARTGWTAIRKAFPTAVFRVIGHSPARAVLRLARMPGIQVVGPVENVETELRRFDVSVAPLRIARGLQNKVLEAMAYGKPVVLTSGAADGIRGRDGQHFLIADQPDQIARAVSRLLGDVKAREQLGRAARRLMLRHHKWAPLMEQFERIVTGVGAREFPEAQVHPKALVPQSLFTPRRAVAPLLQAARF